MKDFRQKLGEFGVSYGIGRNDVDGPAEFGSSIANRIAPSTSSSATQDIHCVPVPEAPAKAITKRYDHIPQSAAAGRKNHTEAEDHRANARARLRP